MTLHMDMCTDLTSTDFSSSSRVRINELIRIVAASLPLSGMPVLCVDLQKAGACCSTPSYGIT